MRPIDDLPEHLKSRKTAEAIMAPSSIVTGGIGAAVAVLAGAPVLLAAGLGVFVYGAVVALRLPRKQHDANAVDPMSLSEPWRSFLDDAQDAQRRFREVIADADAGAIRSRLTELSGRVDEAVSEAGRIARRGDALDEGLARLALDRVHRDLEWHAHQEPPAENTSAHESWAVTMKSLQAQAASGDRIRTVASGARDRLRVLNARLDEMVARAVELSLQTDGVGGLDQLGDDIAGLVDEMEALRLGLEEANAATGGARPMAAGGQ